MKSGKRKARSKSGLGCLGRSSNNLTAFSPGLALRIAVSVRDIWGQLTCPHLPPDVNGQCCPSLDAKPTKKPAVTRAYGFCWTCLDVGLVVLSTTDFEPFSQMPAQSFGQKRKVSGICTFHAAPAGARCSPAAHGLTGLRRHRSANASTDPCCREAGGAPR